MVEELHEVHPIVGTDGKAIARHPATGELFNPPDPVMEAGKRQWGDMAYLHECFQNFFTAVQHQSPKDYQYDDQKAWVMAGMPCWNEKSIFEEWARDTEEHLGWRLEELKEKFDTQRPSDIQLRPMLEAGNVDNPHPFVGHTLTREDYEIYEWTLRKSLEAIRKYRKGEVALRDVMSYDHVES